MHFKSSFDLRNVCGEQVLIANGIENIDFGSLIHLNPTAADIYNHFAGKEFTLEEAVEYITSEYDVDAATATKDIKKLLSDLSANGVVE